MSTDRELLELAAKAAGMLPYRSSWGATLVMGDGSSPGKAKEDK